VDEVHNLSTTGRFRKSLDSFWNLGAELQIRRVDHKMIGLTATLRPDDVRDVMKRMSIGTADVYRQSCYRPGLDIRFLRFGIEKDMIEKACSLATGCVKEGKVLVFTSTVNLCDIMGDQIRGRFNG
jgi:superfamily II DNA helicase RecQ